MPTTAFLGTGFYVPERIVSNQELSERMDTSDDWIMERTGIKERRWISEDETGAGMALSASTDALEQAGMEADAIDAIVLATLSPDHFFPGTGVFLQRELGLAGVPALDIRTQCTGFLYGLSVADAWIKSGQYRTILLVGVEIQSTGIDVTTRGRDMAVLFGDGAGAVVWAPRTMRTVACFPRISTRMVATPRSSGATPRPARGIPESRPRIWSRGGNIRPW